MKYKCHVIETQNTIKNRFSRQVQKAERNSVFITLISVFSSNQKKSFFVKGIYVTVITGKNYAGTIRFNTIKSFIIRNLGLGAV